MENGDEAEEMTDISQQKDPEPSISGVCKKRDHTHNIQQASKYRTTKDPPVTDGEPSLPPPPLSPKRLKKLKTDREISTPRDRSQSRNRLKIKGVPPPTKPGSSLIIPKPMKILQRDLNRSTFIV
jgi:hypothetical protein